MAFETGTITEVNGVLDVLANFLEANGWTILQNYKRPVTYITGTTALDPPPGTEPLYIWRTARNMAATKGNCTVVFEDFYITVARVYGNFTGGFGPGIAATIIDAAGSGPGLFDADFPDFHFYDGGGPAFFGPFDLAGGNAPRSQNLARQKTVIMPLPQITGQASGSWKASTHIMSPAGVTNFPATFGDGGVPTPATYWLMCDPSGDNVVMVMLRNKGDLPEVRVTPFLFFGTSIKKGGTWTGGQYMGASHGNDATWTNNVGPVGYEAFQAQRFGPPGSMMRFGADVHMFLRANVDTFVGKWLGHCNSVDGNVTTGRNFSSTTVQISKPPDTFGDGSLVPNGIHVGTMKARRSTLGSGAPMFPTYFVVQRDNGNYSLLGALPTIFQANTFGIGPGQEWQDRHGQAFMLFDGFAVRKDV